MEKYKYNAVVGCNNEGDNLMVLVIEIIIGMISVLVGLFIISDAYKEYYTEKKYIGNFIIFIEYILGFAVITLGFIVSTLGTTDFYNLIYYFFTMEVF